MRHQNHNKLLLQTKRHYWWCRLDQVGSCWGKEKVKDVPHHIILSSACSRMALLTARWHLRGQQTLNKNTLYYWRFTPSGCPHPIQAKLLKLQGIHAGCTYMITSKCNLICIIRCRRNYMVHKFTNQRNAIFCHGKSLSMSIMI